MLSVTLPTELQKLDHSLSNTSSIIGSDFETTEGERVWALTVPAAKEGAMGTSQGSGVASDETTIGTNKAASIGDGRNFHSIVSHIGAKKKAAKKRWEEGLCLKEGYTKYNMCLGGRYV